ncbi:MAG: TonB-dependent siderophore receptor [Leptolyngbyaceae cyanobacterium]
MSWHGEVAHGQTVPEMALEQVNSDLRVESIAVTAVNTIPVRITDPAAIVVGPTGETLSVAISAPVNPPEALAPNQQAPLISQASNETEPSDADEDSGLLRITVTGESAGSDYFVPNSGTGTRTDTPLLDIPASVQVIPQEVLEDQQVIRLDDALRNVSGVVPDNTEGAGLQFGLRGFAGASILRDGLSLSGSNTNRGIIAVPELANIEQIEVLKGPASILYGEIQPGGVINLVTERPTEEPL